MKRLFTCIIAAAASFQATAQITWSTPVTVTTGTMGSNLHPRISLNRTGDPYIIWGKTDTRVYFSKWNGTGFTTPTVPSGALTVFAQSWAGPDLAAYGDTVYVAMKVTPETSSTNYIYLAHSYNGGTTFATPVRVDNIDTSTSRFPIVTTTGTGNPLMAFMKFNASLMDAHYHVSRSADFGMTFSVDVLASGTAGTVCDCCPASIISSGSNAIMMFRNDLSNIRDIWAGVSTDGGMSFPTTMRPDNSNWNITSCPATGPDGFVIGDSVYSVFMSSGSGMAMVYLGRSSISMGTSSKAAITGMFTGLSAQNYPRIANSGNAAAAVWKQNTSSGVSIASSFTPNISSGFSGYTTVATGSGMQNADVAMSPGVVHIVWEDDNTSSVMYMRGTYATTTVEPLQKELVDVYPNPASGNFSVSVRNLRDIRYSYLSDVTGKHIAITPAMQGSVAVYSTSGIAKGGYYFVMVDNAGKEFYSKLFIQ